MARTFKCTTVGTVKVLITFTDLKNKYWLYFGSLYLPLDYTVMTCLPRHVNCVDSKWFCAWTCLLELNTDWCCPRNLSNSPCDDNRGIVNFVLFISPVSSSTRRGFSDHELHLYGLGATTSLTLSKLCICARRKQKEVLSGPIISQWSVCWITIFQFNTFYLIHCLEKGYIFKTDQ